MIAILAAASLAVSAADKEAKAPVTISDHAWSSTLLGTGIKTNHEYTDGNIFLTVPVWSTIGRDGTLDGSYLFVEPYTSVGSEGEVASSLGLSFRHLFSCEPNSALKKTGRATFFEEGWFVGGSLFVDMLNTERDNKFWQLGVGAEIGSRYLELRGNYYIPLTDKKLAERNESSQTFTSSSTVYQQSGTGFGAPTATGNQIVQDVNLTTSAITTTRTTTVKTVTEIFEEGMEGWDAEVSALLPWVDQWMDVRVIGGYFSFDNQPFGPQEFGTGNVHGWKLGAEVRPVPAVVLSAYWYEDKRFTGADWTVGLQLQVPLDRTWKDAFKIRRRHLVEHLAEPVHRQNDAIKVGNTKEQNSTSNTRVARVTRVVSQTQERLVLADDVIFVNNGGPVGNGIQAGDDPTGTGTAEQPKATIQAGADIAATNNTTTGRVWNVYTQHNPVAPYTEDVAITQSTNFISSASPLMGKGGRSFGTGLMPVLEGSFFTCGCSPLNFVGITGYEIQAFSPAAIEMVNVQTLKIASNKISNPGGSGIVVAMSSGNEGLAQITGNVITQAGAGMDGLLFFVDGVDTYLDAVVTGNTITGSDGSGVDFRVLGEAFADLLMVGNNLTGNGSSGLSVFMDLGDLSASFANNRFEANGAHGVDIYLDNISYFDFGSVGDTFIANAADGLHIESYNESVFSPGTISFAHFENNGGRPLEVTTNTDGIIDLFVQNSMILSTNGLGVHGVVGDGTSGFPNLSLFFFDSTIDVSGVGPAVGIQIEAPSTGIAFLGVFDSMVTVNGLSSVGIQLLGTGISCGCDPSIGALVYDSSINVAGPAAIGIDINASGPSGLGSSFVALDMQHSNITSGNLGVQIVAIDDALVEADIGDRSQITSGGIGVQIVSNGTEGADITVFDSFIDVTGAASIGIDISGSGSSLTTLDMQHSSITSDFRGVQIATAAIDSALVVADIGDDSEITAGERGIDVVSDGTEGVEIGVFDSTVTGGIYLTEKTGSTLDATVSGNLILPNTFLGAGIRFDKSGDSIQADFTNNVVAGDPYGIYIGDSSSTPFTVNLSGNLMSSPAYGLLLDSSGSADFTANINANTIIGGLIGIFFTTHSNGLLHVNPFPTVLELNNVGGTTKLFTLPSFSGPVDGTIDVNGATIVLPATVP